MLVTKKKQVRRTAHARWLACHLHGQLQRSFKNAGHIQPPLKRNRSIFQCGGIFPSDYKDGLPKGFVEAFDGKVVDVPDQSPVYKAYQVGLAEGKILQCPIRPRKGKPLAGFLNCPFRKSKSGPGLIDPVTGQDMSKANCKIMIVDDGECQRVARAYICTLHHIPGNHELLVRYGHGVRLFRGRLPRLDKYFDSSVCLDL